MIENGNQVSIEYTLKLADGSVADTNVGGEALTYEQGASQILPALEDALLGLAVGETKQVELSPAEGYGEVDPGLFQAVPAESVPEDAREVGTQLVGRAANGEAIPVRVHEIREEEIVMDLNHPLAGEDLAFEVKVVAVE